MTTENEGLEALLVARDPVGGTRLGSILRDAPGRAVAVEHVRDPQKAIGLLAARTFDVVLLATGGTPGCLESVDGEPAAPGAVDWASCVKELRQAAGEIPLLVLGERPDEAFERGLRRAGADEVLAWDGAHGAETLLVSRFVHWAIERADLQDSLARAGEQRLRAAYHDPLTDLPNRAFFRQHLRTLLAQMRRSGRSLAVLLIDLDRFKPVNDSLGANSGDDLLRLIARRIAGSVRKGDVVCRKDGDEFLVILEGLAQSQDAGLVARKILREISRPLELGERRLSVTASIGITSIPGDGDEVDKLVRNADVAMGRAKERGGDGYQFFQPEMNESADARLELEQDLRRAIEARELVLHYQPQLDLATRRICGMEALVRWEHPERGMVAPGRFIPLAEETGLIEPIGEWVLDEACAQNRRWQSQGLAPIAISVNLSARQFHDRRPVELVSRALRRTGLEPAWLDLELTESAVMRDADTASKTLASLRELGVSISIDDFGTGHSSLGYLKRFPINRLKIDKTFIATVLEDPRDAAITEAIIGMAHRLDMKAVAEGVENQSQLDFLTVPGCDEVQGFFLSRPVPAEEAGALLAGPPLARN